MAITAIIREFLALLNGIISLIGTKKQKPTPLDETKPVESKNINEYKKNMLDRNNELKEVDIKQEQIKQHIQKGNINEINKIFGWGTNNK